MVKKGCLLAITVLVAGLPGCGWNSKNKSSRTKKETKQIVRKAELFSEVEFPLAEAAATEEAKHEEVVRSFFDQEVEEFITLVEDSEPVVDTHAAHEVIDIKQDEFAWVAVEDKDDFKKTYFEFDRYNVREDQKESVHENIAQAKSKLEEAKQAGLPAKIVVRGHADNSAGSRSYNAALSELRAKNVAEELVAAGVSRDDIMIVGRGQEEPVIIDGKPLVGKDRNQQWPNRRVEMQVVYA